MVKEFAVFDRWGQKVFEAGNIPPNDPRHGWDGTYKGVEAAPGAYVYRVSVSERSRSVLQASTIATGVEAGRPRRSSCCAISGALSRPM